MLNGGKGKYKLSLRAKQRNPECRRQHNEFGIATRKDARNDESWESIEVSSCVRGTSQANGCRNRPR